MRFKFTKPLNPGRHPSGFISVYVMIMVTVFLAMTLAIWKYVESSQVDASAHLAEIQATLLAQTALEEAAYYVKKVDSNWQGTTALLPFTAEGETIGNYQYTVAKSGNLYSVTGLGQVQLEGNQSFSKSLTQDFRYPSPLILFEDGFESGTLAAWAGQDNTGNAEWEVSSTNPSQGTQHARAFINGTGNNRYARLLTPVLDLSGYDTVELRFSLSKVTGFDNLDVEVDTGSGFSSILAIAVASVSSGTYTRPSFRVFLPTLSATTQIQFSVRIDLGDELHLDNVRLATPSVPYDVDIDS